LHKRIDHRPYPASAYDEEWCLKQPLPLWLAVLFLTRALLLPLLMGLGHYVDVNPALLQSLRADWEAAQLLPALIALPVAAAAWRRVASAGAAVRGVWRRGRALLLLATAVDLALNLAALRHPGNGIPLPLLFAALDLYAAGYLTFTRRVRDAFAEFPGAPG